MANRPRIHDLDAFARAAREEGVTFADLAERFGCSIDTVRRTRAKLGIPSPARRLAGELRERVEAAIEDGWSVKEIERTYGVEHRTVTRHFPGAHWTLAQGLDRQRAERHFEENVRKVAYASPLA
jgi:transcriptional regulator GlxA family with amidase domain